MIEEQDQWLKNNDAYLAKSLAWLRLRLVRLLQQHCPAPAACATPSFSVQPEINSFNWRFWERSSRTDITTDRKLLPPAPLDGAAGIVTDGEIAAAADEMRQAEAMSPPPALIILANRFGLSRFEQQILLLCAASELDTRIGPLCARAQDDLNRPYATFALALALFDDPSWDALSPLSPLRHWRLLEINQPGAQPLVTSALRADERIVNFLKGLSYLDDRLAPLLTSEIFDELDVEIPDSQQAAAQMILCHAKQSLRVPLIQLVGADIPSKRIVAAHVVTAMGLRLYRLPVELIPAHAGELEMLAKLIEREMALWPFAVYLDGHELDKSPASDTQVALLQRFLARSNGVFFLDTVEIRQDLSRQSLIVDVVRPSQSEQRNAWMKNLGHEDNGISAALAGQFDLSLPVIRSIGSAALIESSTTTTPLSERVWTACLLNTRPRLEALAQRIEARARWDDIVLPESELKLLHQITTQVKQRGRVYLDWGFAAARTRGLSINALFSGESGTGKTMAAEVIANELQLDLYRIDLSAVINKYIGETEKNLRRVFDAAECGGVILFFDEADALFGKRSEVKDSHDRYANIEVNYLLQRLESYRGLAILATNMRSALDTSFMRRIRFIVEFRSQSLLERKAIWQRIFPAETKTAGLDYEWLAKLNLNGGSINNVAINAAFLAAQANTPVTMPLILYAARTEFVKLKRPVNESDFYWVEGVEAAA